MKKIKAAALGVVSLTVHVLLSPQARPLELALARLLVTAYGLDKFIHLVG